MYFFDTQKDVRDIFSPIHFEVKYDLGGHSVLQQDPRGLPALKPILQQKEMSNVVKNQVSFSFASLCYNSGRVFVLNGSDVGSRM